MKNSKIKLWLYVAIMVLAILLSAVFAYGIKQMDKNDTKGSIETLWDGETRIKPAGTGSYDDPFVIASAGNLAYMAQDMSFDEYNFYTLTNDIDINKKDWTPIGSSSANPFHGHFYGNGHKITNIGVATGGYYVSMVNQAPSLFGFAKNAEIYGVDVTYAFDSVSGTSSFGGILNWAMDSVTIECCSNSTKKIQFNNVDSQFGFGGLVGYANSWTNIKNSLSLMDIEVNGKVNGVGGLMGVCAGENNSISYSYTTAKITSSEDSKILNKGSIVGISKSGDKELVSLDRVFNTSDELGSETNPEDKWEQLQENNTYWSLTSIEGDDLPILTPNEKNNATHGHTVIDFKTFCASDTSDPGPVEGYEHASYGFMPRSYVNFELVDQEIERSIWAVTSWEAEFYFVLAIYEHVDDESDGYYEMVDYKILIEEPVYSVNSDTVDMYFPAYSFPLTFIDNTASGYDTPFYDGSGVYFYDDNPTVEFRTPNYPHVGTLEFYIMIESNIRAEYNGRRYSIDDGCAYIYAEEEITVAPRSNDSYNTVTIFLNAPDEVIEEVHPRIMNNVRFNTSNFAPSEDGQSLAAWVRTGYDFYNFFGSDFAPDPLESQHYHFMGWYIYSDSIDIERDEYFPDMPITSDILVVGRWVREIDPPTLSNYSYTYDGKSHSPTIYGFDDEIMTKSGDESGINVASYRITFRIRKNYLMNYLFPSAQDSWTVGWDINPATIGVTKSGEGTFTYDGASATHALGISMNTGGCTVKYGTSSGSYTTTKSLGSSETSITFGSYADAGTYTIYYQVSKTNYSTITGNVSLTISPKSVESATITPVGNQTWTGSPITPTPTATITLGGTSHTLTSSEITYTYANNTAVGSATVTINGIGNFTGSKSTNFNIIKPALKGTATISGATTYGSSLSASVSEGWSDAKYSYTWQQCSTQTGTFADITGATGSSLTLSASATGITSLAGKYIKVIIRDSSGYTGSLEKVVGPVGQKALSFTNTPYANTKTYDNTNTATLNGSLTLAGVLSGDVCTLTAPTSITFNNENAGEGKVVTITGYSLTGTHASNYSITSTTTTTGTISKRGASVSWTNNTPYTYSSGATAGSLTPSYSVSGLVSGDGVSYSVSVSGEKYTGDVPAVGDHTITITLTGAKSTNYTLSSPSANFTVKAGTLNVSTSGTGNITYDGNSHSVSLSVNESATIGYSQTSGSYSNSTTGTSVTFGSGTNAATYTWYYQVSKQGYTTVTGTATLTISPMSVASASIASVGNQVWTGSAITPTPTATITLGGKAHTLTSSEITYTYANNTAVGTATITINGKGNFNGSKSTSFTIIKPDIKGTANISGTTTYGSTLSAGVSGGWEDAKYTYTWQYSTSATGSFTTISGATSSTLTLNAATAKVDLVAGKYIKVIISDSTGYTSSLSAVSGQIAVKTLTFSASPTVTAREYNNTTTASLSGSFTLGGVVSGDDCTLSTTGMTATYADVHAGDSKVVTVKGYSLAGKHAGNYSITSTTTLTGKITKKAASVTWDKTKSYTYSEGASATSLTPSYTVGGLVTGDGVTHSVSVDAPKYGDVPAPGKHTATVTLSGTNAGDYTLSTPTYEYTIAEGSLTVTPTGDGTKTYNGSAYSVGISISATADVGYSQKSGDYSTKATGTKAVTFGSGTTVGTYTWYYQVTKQGYTTKTGSVTLTISALNIASAKVADVANQTYSASAITPKPAVTITLGTTSYAMKEGTDFDYSWSNNVNAGSGTITIKGKGNFSGEITKQFTIERKVVTVKWTNNTPYTYSSTATAQQLTPSYTLDGLITSDGVGSSTTISGTMYSSSIPAPGEHTITITLTGEKASNYSLSGGSTSFIVNSGSLNVTQVGNETITYDGKTHSIGVNVSETATIGYSQTSGNYTANSVSNTAATFATQTNAGSYTWYYKVSKTGYNDVTGTITLKINQFDITSAVVSATANQTYTGSAINLKPTITVQLGGTTSHQLAETTEVIYSYASNVDIGKATITMTGTGNYTGTLTQNFQINQKSVTITCTDPASLVYTSSATYKSLTPTYTIAGLVEADKVESTYTISGDKISNVPAPGKHTMTVTLTGDKAGNYTISNPTHDFTVIAGTLVVTETGEQTITYDGVAHNIGITVSESASIGYGPSTSYTSATTDTSVTFQSPKDAGTYKWYYRVSKNGFTTIEGSVTLVINPLDITSTGTIEGVASQVYTGSQITPKPKLTIKLNGTDHVLAETSEVTYSYSANTDVGSATITLTGTGNYTGKKTTSFSITQKAVTVTWTNNKTYTYSSTATADSISPSYTTSGIVEGDSVTVSATISDRLINGVPAPGEHTKTVKLSGTKAGNYTLTNPTAEFTVVAGTLVVTKTGAQTITYDAASHEIGIKVSESATVKYSQDKASLTSSKTEAEVIFTSVTDAGTHTWYYEVSKDGFTTITDSVTLTINKKDVTVTWSETTTFTYTGTEQGPTYTIDGIITTDGTTHSVANNKKTDAGSYSAVVSLGGTKTNNYTLKNGTQAWSITQATDTTITLSAESVEMAVGETKTLTATLTWVGTTTNKNLTISGQDTYATITSSDFGTGKQSTISITANSGTDSPITITLTFPADTNHTAVTKTFTLMINSITVTLKTASNGYITSGDHSTQNQSKDVSFVVKKNATDVSVSFHPSLNYGMYYYTIDGTKKWAQQKTLSDVVTITLPTITANVEVSVYFAPIITLNLSVTGGGSSSMSTAPYIQEVAEYSGSSKQVLVTETGTDKTSVKIFAGDNIDVVLGGSALHTDASSYLITSIKFGDKELLNGAPKITLPDKDATGKISVNLGSSTESLTAGSTINVVYTTQQAIQQSGGKSVQHGTFTMNATDRSKEVDEGGNKYILSGTEVTITVDNINSGYAFVGFKGNGDKIYYNNSNSGITKQQSSTDKSWVYTATYNEEISKIEPIIKKEYTGTSSVTITGKTVTLEETETKLKYNLTNGSLTADSNIVAKLLHGHYKLTTDSGATVTITITKGDTTENVTKSADGSYEFDIDDSVTSITISVS